MKKIKIMKNALLVLLVSISLMGYSQKRVLFDELTNTKFNGDEITKI